MHIEKTYVQADTDRLNQNFRLQRRSTEPSPVSHDRQVTSYSERSPSTKQGTQVQSAHHGAKQTLVRQRRGEELGWWRLRDDEQTDVQSVCLSVASAALGGRSSTSRTPEQEDRDTLCTLGLMEDRVTSAVRMYCHWPEPSRLAARIRSRPRAFPGKPQYSETSFETTLTPLGFWKILRSVTIGAVRGDAPVSALSLRDICDCGAFFSNF